MFHMVIQGPGLLEAMLPPTYSSQIALTINTAKYGEQEDHVFYGLVLEVSYFLPFSLGSNKTTGHTLPQKKAGEGGLSVCLLIFKC